MNKKITTGTALGIILTGLIIILGVLFLNDNIVKNDITAKSIQRDQPKDNCKSTEEKELISVLTHPLGQHKLAFELQVPKSWRATLENSEHIGQPYKYSNDNLAVFKFISPFLAHPQDSGLLPVNNLGFYDVTEWSEEETKADNSRYYINDIKAAEKKDYFNFLINTRKKKQDSDFSACKSIFVYNCSGSEKLYIESADGVFSGFASIQTSPHAAQDDPTVHVYMAGKINEKTIYVVGSFILYEEIDKLIEKEVFQQRYNDVLAVVRSIKVSAIERQ